VTVYATQTDLARHGVRTAATTGVASGDLDAALAAASAFADGYLANRYTLPLLTYGADLTACVCKLAAWEVLSALRGHSPDGGDAIWKTRRDEAVAWLEKVASRDVTPASVTDSTPDYEESGEPKTKAPSLRGW
jgi:phage gp36-like protein